jgi:hypothetical protein
VRDCREGPLADYIYEAHCRAAFLEVIAVALTELPDPGGVLTNDALVGFLHFATDLKDLTLGLNARVDAAEAET